MAFFDLTDGSAQPGSGALTAVQLKQLAQQPGTVLVDVRPRWRYRQGHIPGSHSIPAGLLLAGEPPEGDLLLIGTDSKHSATLIEQLHEKGYNRRLLYLEGGYASWSARQPSLSTEVWKQRWAQGQQLIGGPALLLAGGATQSLGLLALGLVIWLGPWALERSRA
jgi:rhodanese-related sulfurtransferase